LALERRKGPKAKETHLPEPTKFVFVKFRQRGTRKREGIWNEYALNLFVLLDRIKFYPSLKSSPQETEETQNTQNTKHIKRRNEERARERGDISSHTSDINAIIPISKT
jgi:hypothetical protein